jgi:hypothetical protein
VPLPAPIHVNPRPSPQQTADVDHGYGDGCNDERAEHDNANLTQDCIGNVSSTHEGPLPLSGIRIDENCGKKKSDLAGREAEDCKPWPKYHSWRNSLAGSARPR